MPNVMAALPNISGVSVQHRKVWLTPTTRVPCSNAAKTRSPLKFAAVPRTRQQISAASMGWRVHHIPRTCGDVCILLAMVQPTLDPYAEAFL